MDTAILCLSIVAVTALAYQVARPLSIDIGGPYDGPWVTGFHDREGDSAFSWRWSRADASVNVPGVGAGWYILSISMGAGERPALPTVSLWVNGQKKASFKASKEQTVYELHLTPRDFLAGDLLLTISSDTYVPPKDPRSLGVAVDWVRIEPDRQVPRVPSFGVLTYALLVALCCLFSLKIARAGPWATSALLGLMVSIYTLALIINRAEVAAFLPRLLTAALLSAPIPIAVSVLLGNSQQRGRPEKTPLGENVGYYGSSPTVSMERPLWIGMVAAFSLLVSLAKVGGTLYPQIIIIDMPFHLAQIRQVLAGNFWKLYWPGSLSLAVMPEREWTVRAPIPYSPFFYLFMSPLAWLPWDMRLTVPLLNSVLEAWKFPLILFLGRKLALDRSESAVAAVTYGLAGAMYMLLQWGNWPTTFSQWFAVAGLTVLVGVSDIRRGLRYWVTTVGGAVLLFVAYVSYTVTATFLLALLVIIGGYGILWRRRFNSSREIWGLCCVLLAAWIAAFAVYYSAHLYVAVTQTLPAFAGALATQGSLTTRTGTLYQYILSNISAFGNYGLTPIFVVGPWGIPLLWGRWQPERKAIVLGWIGILVLFTVVGFKVDMVLKHVWFTVPLMGCLAGPVLVRLGRSGFAGQVVLIALMGFMIWVSGSLWTWRIWVASH